MNDNKMWSLYIHTNKINNKKYVGITSRKTTERWGKDGKGYTIDNTYFGNAIKKYGWDNFEHEIIFDACLTKEKAEELEKYYIKTLNTKRPNGYNLTDGGEGISGYTITEEHRKKLSKRQKERFKNPEDNPMYGKHHTEETKKILSEAHKKENLSDETIRRMSDSAKNLWSNEEYKNRRLQELKEARDKVPYVYRPMSDKQKQILSNARKEKCSGANNSKARKVWCIELELSFETIKEAGEHFNAKQTTYKKIGDCCSGTRNTCMGYHWMYYEDYLNSTEEDVQKILNKQNNTRLSNNGRAKAVKCVETNEKWLSAEEAAIFYGVNGENIRRSCREGSAIKLNGYHFEYIQQLKL